MPARFGILPAGSAQYPPATPPTQCVDDVLHEVRLARDLGLDGVFFAQHFLSDPFYTLQSIPLIGRVTPESGNLTLGATIVLLALLNPVEVAEYITTLDAITNGRMVLGVGLGYREIELEAFGLERKNLLSRFEESLEVLKMVLTNETVNFDGKFFRLKNVKVSLRPIQRPRPQIWLAADSDAAVKRAARYGDTWIAPPHNSFNTLQRQLSIFKSERDAARLAHPSAMPLRRELYLDNDRDKARKEAEPFVMNKFKVLREWGQDKAVPKGDEFTASYDEFVSSFRFIIGTPDDCIDVLSKLYDAGFNYFLFRTKWPGLDSQLSRKTIQLLGEKVVPYFRQK